MFFVFACPCCTFVWFPLSHPSSSLTPRSLFVSLSSLAKTCAMLPPSLCAAEPNVKNDSVQCGGGLAECTATKCCVGPGKCLLACFLCPHFCLSLLVLPSVLTC